MNMKKIFKRTSLLLATALIGVTVQAQKSPQDMDRFIDALMRRMTVEEKIGQLNLPVTGEITTGQAKSSDVAKKIEQGLVGGLFNLKGVAKIRDGGGVPDAPLYRIFVTHSPLHNPIKSDEPIL